ncbi:unnamed protein product, partial [Prorocentrum cordatum]
TWAVELPSSRAAAGWREGRSRRPRGEARRRWPSPSSGVDGHQCEHCRIRGHDHAVAGEPQRGGLGDEDRHRDDYYDYYDYYDHDHHHDDDSGDGARLRGQSSRLGVVNGALLQLLQVGPLLHRVRGLRPELVLAGLHQECQRPGGEREGDE